MLASLVTKRRAARGLTAADTALQPAASAAVERQLVEMLFNQTTSLVLGGLALATVAGIGWLHTGETWFLVWAAATAVALAGRLLLERAFHHRRNTADSLGAWRARFIAGALVMGALWGVGALTIVNRDDPLVAMFVVCIETVIIMGAAARNASCLPAARGQAVLALGPLFIACIVRDDPYYRAFSVVFVFALFAVRALFNHLYDQRVRFLCLNEELAAANQKLAGVATTDALTGIANRRCFDEHLADEVLRSQRERTDLALLLLDIDFFKGFNDLYGHQAGDECLQRVAQALAVSVHRGGDLVARYGGEEFVAILPRTKVGAAGVLADEIRRAIEGLTLRSAASPVGVVSVSIGVAGFAPGAARRPEDFIRSADEALYAAKAAGRNCVRVAPDACGDAVGAAPAAGAVEAFVAASVAGQSSSRSGP